MTGGSTDLGPGEEAGQGARATRLWRDWRPTDEDLGRAAELGFGEAEISLAAERFRYHYLTISGPGALSRDWSLTFRKWLLGNLERRGVSRRTNEGDKREPGLRRTHTDVLVDAFLESARGRGNSAGDAACGEWLGPTIDLGAACAAPSPSVQDAPMGGQPERSHPPMGADLFAEAGIYLPARPKAAPQGLITKRADGSWRFRFKVSIRPGIVFDFDRRRKEHVEIERLAGQWRPICQRHIQRLRDILAKTPLVPSSLPPTPNLQIATIDGRPVAGAPADVAH